jgi:hypothetical protein
MFAASVKMIRWFIRWIVEIWVRINVFFWFLYSWIISRDFSYVCDVLECLILSTKRELKIRTSSETLLMMISLNTRFFSKLFISFLRDFTNVNLSELFDNWSFWRKTIMFVTFWYLRSRRFAWIDLIKSARSSSNSRIDLVINARLWYGTYLDEVGSNYMLSFRSSHIIYIESIFCHLDHHLYIYLSIHSVQALVVTNDSINCKIYI